MGTKEHFIATMFELLKQHSIEKITVDMILEASELSRSSFYRLFQDKYQLMVRCYASYIGKVKQDALARKDWRTALEQSFQFMVENKRFCENLFKGDDQDAFSKFLYADYVHELREIYSKPGEALRFTLFEHRLIDFYALGIVNFQREWVKYNMDIAPAVMVDIIIGSMPEPIRRIPVDVLSDG